MDFVEWMEATRRRYQRLEFRIVESDIRLYRNLADARLVLEIMEQEAGKPLETLHSLDLIHLIHQRGEWRVIHHAWTMEAPDAPLSTR